MMAGARQRTPPSQPAAFLGASISSSLPHCDGAVIERPDCPYQPHHAVLVKHSLRPGRRNVVEEQFAEQRGSIAAMSVTFSITLPTNFVTLAVGRPIASV